MVLRNDRKSLRMPLVVVPKIDTDCFVILSSSTLLHMTTLFILPVTMANGVNRSQTCLRITAVLLNIFDKA